MRLLRLVSLTTLVLLIAKAAAAQGLTATLTFPGAGEVVNIDIPAQSFQWTSVPTADAYYLYVGTSLGAKNVVDSGELHYQTSYQIRTLPVSQVLYLRLWTKVSGIWRYIDSTCTVVTFVPRFTYPQPGATSFNPALAWTWISTPNAQAYFVYVGSTPGASDLASSGEIHTTSFQPSSLPADRVIYARLWVKIGGIWRYTDTTFTVTLTPAITYPINGSAISDLTTPVRWTTVATADAYYLYVGSSPGLHDLINSRETSQTSWPIPNTLPVGQTLYVRIWSKVHDVWRWSDSTFSVLPTAATLIYPVNGSSGFDQTIPATWNAVPGALSYYLYIGTTPGARDLIDSSETPLTSFRIAALPPGQTVYARLWTRFPAYWRYTDSSFSAGPIGPEFVYPREGEVAADTTQAIEWVPSAGAEAHWLYVGTSPGANDLLDSGELQSPSVVASDLPSLRTVYARAWSKVNGQWTRHSDIAFTPRPRSPRSVMLAPVDGATFDTGQPFQWTAAPMGRAYRLTIGTSPGGSDLHDSGEIHVTRRFVPGLPVAVPLYGRLQTLISGQWRPSDFTFTVTANSFSSPAQIDSALWATDFVRNMAPSDNRPFAWTPMLAGIAPRYGALCTDYAALLLTMLREVNIGLAARRLDISFNGTNLAAHTLVEMLDPGSGRWMILDPTFDVTALRSDGTWASADDISQATLTANWSAINYVFLGQSGDALLRNYYMDYPLLFVNVHHEGDPFALGQGQPVWSYMQTVAMPVENAPQAYVVQCATSLVARVFIDGVATDIACNGVDQTSAVFVGSTIAPVDSGASLQLYQMRRFVF